MQLPENTFKTALQAGRHQLGLWCTLPGAYAAELLAGTGFDWLLFDTEHSPNDPIDVLAQLQAVAAYPVTAVVRPACNDTVLIKRMLDTGVQTLLIPYVQNEEEARQAVASTRYPPEGVRGVAGMTRASGFGRIPAYTRHAASQLCLLVQVETQESLENLDSIIAVDGVDGVFIGPADLAASLGYPGELGHPEVVSAIEAAILRIRQAGKPAGILSTDEAFAHRCKELGTLFTAVGVDAAVLARQAEALANRMR